MDNNENITLLPNDTKIIKNQLNITNVLCGIVIVAFIIIAGLHFRNKNNLANKKQLKICNNNDEALGDLTENQNFDKYTIIDCLRNAAKKYPRHPALKIKEKSEKKSENNKPENNKPENNKPENNKPENNKPEKNNKSDWITIDYVTYYKNVVNFAQSLNYWLGNHVTVAIMGSNSPGWFYAHMGSILNGGKSAGIYTESSKELCKQIIKDSNAKVLVVENDEQLKKIINISIPSIQLIIYYSPISESMIDKFTMPVLSMGNFMSKKNSSKFPKIQQSDPATLIYTSGTTGKPKGVILTHKNIITSMSRTIKLVKTKSSIGQLFQEQFISYLPLNHISAQMMDIYIPITTIGTVWFADKTALRNNMATTLKQIRPTCFVGLPRIWEKIKHNISDNLSNQGMKGKMSKYLFSKKILEHIGLDRCKLAISVAAPLSTSVYKYFSSIGLEINNMYGMSEACGLISISLPKLNKIGSVGYPITGIKISDDKEILIKGDNVFTGYHNNKKETDASFTKNGWFNTGDLGLLDDRGFLYIVGRKKDIIVTSGGENIAPAPIELKLQDHLDKYFDYVIVVGDNLKYLSVLLVTTKKLPHDINTIVENSITNVNNTAQSPVHTIKKFLILNKKFAINKELTPTLKPKRSYIIKKYDGQIKKLYM